MATANKNLSQHDGVPSGEGRRIAIVVSEWNTQVTFALRDGAVATLKKHNVRETDIHVFPVPGAFELTAGATWSGEKNDIDAVICLGCVIRGETPHFEFICSGVTQGITALNLQLGKPVIFGVLTTDTLQQALDRAGGKHGNKGDEAAVAALKMLALRDQLKK